VTGTMMSRACADSASAGMLVFYFGLSFYSIWLYLYYYSRILFYNATFPIICSVQRKLIDQLAVRLSQNGY
jgi:hypothetical protein